MTGRYEIVLYNNKICYRLDVKRNITVLRGDSASGKSELIRLLGAYNSNPSSSGITLICEKKCTVLNEENWQLFTETYSDRIFFIDEGNGFLRTTEFADTVKRSDNYYIIISREGMPNLPYSIEEIYGLKNVSDNQKYKSYKRIYNEMYKLYDFNISKEFEPDTVLTEDSNSGYDFFYQLYGEKCISAKGKSNVYQCIRDNSDKQILAIVDGAAFGAEIGKIYRYLESNYVKCVIYAPESFEFLLLSAGFVDVPYDVTAETWKYADSKLYMSWEEFYTDHLIKNTSGTVYQYNKNRLAAPYKTEGIISKVVSVMPDEILLK